MILTLSICSWRSSRVRFASSCALATFPSIVARPALGLGLLDKVPLDLAAPALALH